MKTVKSDRSVATEQDLSDWETLVQSYTVDKVNFSDARAKLSRMVADSHGFVKVQNRQAGDFLAISVVEMEKFLTDLLGSQVRQASFFDGMEEFESGATIPYSELAELPAANPEYSDEDLDSLRARVGADRTTRTRGD